MPRTAPVPSAAGNGVSTGIAEDVRTAASLATTKALVGAHIAVHWQGSICQPAGVRFAGRRDSVLTRRQPTRARLATSLKLAIKALQTNIRKLERTEAHPLLIAARKRELLKMQEELTRLRREEGKESRGTDRKL